MSSRSEMTGPARLAVVGTDLKFIEPLIARFEATGLFEIRVDEWPKFRTHDETQTAEMIDWADIIVCEWAGPNAVIASRSKRPDQRLVVRLHRMELDHPDWRDIDIDAVDLVITVGPYYRRRVPELTRWPEKKVVLVPNFVDSSALGLPKSPGARHRLGMLGAASARKRLGIGLDVLRSLREKDDRYELSVKGSYPWDLKWVEDRPEEAAYFAEIRTRLENDLLLRDAVTFDPPGADVPAWLQTIGFLLSTSDDESFHLSPAEAMASRAVPVIRPWPGADEVYDPKWVVDGAEAMAQRILDVGGDEKIWRELGEEARQEMISKYDIDDVVANWLSVLTPGQSTHPLRIGVVSTRNPYTDPSLMALAHSLDSVGHRVDVISRAPRPEDLPGSIETTVVGADPPRLSWKRLRNRLRGRGPDEADVMRTMSAALQASQPDVVYPQRIEDLPIAETATAPVVRRPTWPETERDLVTMAPQSPAWSVSPSTPDWARASLRTWPEYSPAPQRHQGKAVVVVYRMTPTSPGRYLESALRRAGMTVTALDGQLDWSRVPSGAEFVVIVESAYPAFPVKGPKPDVPIFFWVHHGEHHLPANLRLTYRYQADAVLMAHSWHLAHRFPVPTHRFPFGVATELGPGPKPWGERRFDVAMVGSGIGGAGKRYDRRREIVDSIASASDIESTVAYGIPPNEMLSLYGDSRIVVNDGGPRHFPITMRVFETLCAGALLLTEDIPGTDTILRRGEHFVAMDHDVVGQIRSLLTDEASAGVAEAGHRSGLSRHTYDHRVDRLVELAARTATISHRDAPFQPKSDLAALIDQDVDVQHLATFGEVGGLGLNDRAVRAGDSRLREKSVDAVVIGRGPVDDLRRAVRAARGYVYATGEHQGEIRRILSEERADAHLTLEDGLLRADIGQTPYRVRPADHPLAT